VSIHLFYWRTIIIAVISNAAPINFCRVRFESLVRLGRSAGRYRIGLDIIEQHDKFPDLRAVSQFLTDFGIQDQVDPNNIFTLEINTKKQVSACWNLGPIYAAKDRSSLVMQVGNHYFELHEGVDAKGYFI
jgi:hypothetical protein